MEEIQSKLLKFNESLVENAIAITTDQSKNEMPGKNKQIKRKTTGAASVTSNGQAKKATRKSVKQKTKQKPSKNVNVKSINVIKKVRSLDAKKMIRKNVMQTSVTGSPITKRTTQITKKTTRSLFKKMAETPKLMEEQFKLGTDYVSTGDRLYDFCLSKVAMLGKVMGLKVVVGLMAITFIVSILTGIMVIYSTIDNSILGVFMDDDISVTHSVKGTLNGYVMTMNGKLSECESQGDDVIYPNNGVGVSTDNLEDMICAYVIKMAGPEGMESAKDMFTDEYNIVDTDEEEELLTQIFNEFDFYNTDLHIRNVKKNDIITKAPVSVRVADRKEGIDTVRVDSSLFPIDLNKGAKIEIEGNTYKVRNSFSTVMGNEMKEPEDLWGNLKSVLAMKDNVTYVLRKPKPYGIEIYIEENLYPLFSYLQDGSYVIKFKKPADKEKYKIKKWKHTVSQLTLEDWLETHPLTPAQADMLAQCYEVLNLDRDSFDGINICSSSELGGAAVVAAMRCIGCQYSQELRWEEGYYDCSSLCIRAYKKAGFNFPGSVSTAADLANYCVGHFKTVKRDNLQPGDLIFYSYEKNNRFRDVSHVAMYMGKGLMIEARNEMVGVVRSEFKASNINLYGRPY